MASAKGSQANLVLLCSECSFLKWGTWDAHINYPFDDSQSNEKDKSTGKNNNLNNNSNDSTNNEVFARGWWVAADEITSEGDLEQLGSFHATANYNGTAWGTVANGIGGGWQTYDASGDLTMNWNFNSRTGDLTISKFDTAHFDGGLKFSGPMSVPGVVCTSDPCTHFSGSLSGKLPDRDLSGSATGSLDLNGSAAGSFVNNNGVIAAGVMGKWNIDSAAYRATGIFGGVGTPVPGH